MRPYPGIMEQLDGAEKNTSDTSTTTGTVVPDAAVIFECLRFENDQKIK